MEGRDELEESGGDEGMASEAEADGVVGGQPTAGEVGEVVDLARAEQIAGVRTRAVRDTASRVIDICIIDTSGRSSSYDAKLAERLRDAVGSKTLFVDASYGGTSVGLSFDEAHLTQEVLRRLRRRGFKPSILGVEAGRR